MRKLGLLAIQCIQLIRYFGPGDGIKAFFSLHAGKEYMQINCKKFKNSVHLRKTQSDPHIFEQVFCELQYAFPERENLAPQLIIDGGANIGMAALYFASIYPQAKIICIEPDSDNFNLLQKNTANYNSIKCIHAGLWHVTGTLEIQNTSEFSAGYMVGEAGKGATKTIPALTLLDLINEQGGGKSVMVKLDIEGAEKEIFCNDCAWLEKTDVLMVELHDWLKPGTSKCFFSKMAAYNWLTYIKGENIITIKK